MAITRANAEAILIKRIGTLFTAVSLDGTTATGANADLNDPIWTALIRLGYTVADLSAAADTDLAALSADDQLAFFDVAELRALETAHNAASSLVDISVGPRRESLSQLAARLEALIKGKREAIKADHGELFGGTLETGVISLGFQEDGSNVY